MTSQLAQLVPTFDPGQDNVEQWKQKTSLLAKAWPEAKLLELQERIVLNTKGSAVQKLELCQSEVLTGAKEGTARILELVSGQFGQVALEKKFDVVDKALFKCQQ